MLSLSVASPSMVTFPPKNTLSSLTKSSFHGVKLRQTCPIRVATTSSSGRPASSVVMMAKKEEELKEIRAKSTEELNQEICDLKGDLLMLRIQRANRNEFKSSEFRRMRKRVRILIFLSFGILEFCNFSA